jgi:hypothetical protein
VVVPPSRGDPISLVLHGVSNANFVFLNWNTSTDSMPCIYRCENKPTDDLPALFIFSFSILNDQTNHRMTKSTYLNLQL